MVRRSYLLLAITISLLPTHCFAGLMVSCISASDHTRSTFLPNQRSTSKTNVLLLETEGLVVKSSTAGFKLMPVILDDMRPDEVLKK